MDIIEHVLPNKYSIKKTSANHKQSLLCFEAIHGPQPLIGPRKTSPTVSQKQKIASLKAAVAQGQYLQMHLQYQSVANKLLSFERALLTLDK